MMRPIRAFISAGKIRFPGNGDWSCRESKAQKSASAVVRALGFQSAELGQLASLHALRRTRLHRETRGNRVCCSACRLAGLSRGIYKIECFQRSFKCCCNSFPANRRAGLVSFGKVVARSEKSDDLAARACK